MLVFAEVEFSGVKPHKHGGSENDHIKSLRAMGAEVPEDNNEIPKELSYLYGIFKDIRFSKVPNNDKFSLLARESLTYNEIDFYAKQAGLDFELWEFNALLSLNAIFDKASQ